MNGAMPPPSEGPSPSQLRARLHALLLGVADMDDVGETASYLLGDHPEARGHDGEMPWRARRTLEAGMVVTYARPFAHTRGGGLPKLGRRSNLPTALLATHDELLRRRNVVYAHTDATPLRQILDVVDAGGLETWLNDPARFSEQWVPPTREILADVVTLAAMHRDGFLREADAVRVRLQDGAAQAGRSTRPSKTPNATQ